MDIPILLVASGTSSRASVTYRLLEDRCRSRFPGHHTSWAYSSERVRELAKDRYGLNLPAPEEVLADLKGAGHRDVVVQSVHLICGEEFHQVARTAAASDLNAAVGKPLLSGPEDLLAGADALAPAVEAPTGTAVLIVGHGTRHPAGLIYDLFDRFLQERYGSSVRVRVLNGHPGMDGTGDDLWRSGFRRVRLVPLMLVAGAHARKDIDGDKEESVRRQLERHGFGVESRLEGLLESAAVVECFCDHIAQAIDAIRGCDGEGG